MSSELAIVPDSPGAPFAPPASSSPLTGGIAGVLPEVVPAQLREGYRRAKEVTRAHAKSFYFASFLLFGRRRRAAFALYAFCRRLDDLVDGDAGPSPEPLAQRLAQARRTVRSLYAGLPELADPRFATQPSEEPERIFGDPSELLALAETVRAFRIPEAPFQDLISGMEMDLVKARYASWAELDLYCHRVAGVVGLLMTPVLGYAHERALGPACELGKAMQLTNILRDVREDWERGRVYLPAQELEGFGVTEAQLARGVADERFVALMKFQISRARALYARAAQGIADLRGFGSRPMVRLMAVLYGDILREIEAQRYDVFARRAHISFGKKLGWALRVLFRPRSLAQLGQGGGR